MYFLTFMGGTKKMFFSLLNSNLDIANKSARPFLFTISNVICLVNPQNRSCGFCSLYHEIHYFEVCYIKVWVYYFYVNFFCCCQVTLCIYALARTTQKHADYTGPSMGPKMATENKRNFSEEQIRQGRDGQVGLQVIHLKLDLVNVVVRPLLFTKLILFTKSSLDKQ